jgi:predicted O-methyltransferase YrrM
MSLRSENLPELLLEAFATKRVFDSEGKPQPLESNITHAEASDLYVAVKRLRPEDSVEIGLAYGVSALAILAAISANGSGHHYVVDPFQRNYGYCGEAMIERAGYRQLHSFLERFPEEVLPDLPRMQFAFIDSSHLFDLTILEFALIDKKLAVNGLLALHDTWMPSIQTAVRFILANRAYEICRNYSSNETTLSIRQRFKQMVGRCLGIVPGVDRYLNSNVLRPWSTFRVGNLIFLRKLSEDQRDWRFHRRF